MVESEVLFLETQKVFLVINLFIFNRTHDDDDTNMTHRVCGVGETTRANGSHARARLRLRLCLSLARITKVQHGIDLGCCVASPTGFPLLRVATVGSSTARGWMTETRRAF